jgi:hypothetical protein
VLDNAPGGHDILLVGAVRFLVIVVVVTSCGCNPLRALLSPLLAALGIFGSLDGDARWPVCLLIGCILGSYVEQLLGGVLDDVI